MLRARLVMLHCWIVIAALGAVLRVMGCTPHPVVAVPAPSEPSVATDSVSYGIRDTADHLVLTIGTTVTNHTESTVYFDTFCNGKLEKRTHEGWRLAFSLTCRLGSDASALVPLSRGSSYTHTYRVWANITGGNPRFEVDPISGTYRLVYRLYTGAEGNRSQLLPEEERASNTFTLRE